MCWSGGDVLKQPTTKGCGMIVLWLEEREREREKMIFFFFFSLEKSLVHTRREAGLGLVCE
jgi:hypothetical protein